MALESLGLSDIMVIVRLMCLCTSGKVTLPGQEFGQQGASLQCLNHLTSAIGALVEENTAAQRQLLELCTKVCSSLRQFHLEKLMYLIYMLITKLTIDILINPAAPRMAKAK